MNQKSLFSFFLFCFFGATLNLRAQTVTIAQHDFDANNSFLTVTGGTVYTGNSAAVDGPATSPLAISGNSSGINNGTATYISSPVDTRAYNSIQLSFRVASFSIGNATNGADATDLVKISVDTLATATFATTHLTINGGTTGNAYWGFGATGTATTAYPTVATFAPSGTGLRTADGYSTMTVTNLPSAATLRIKITLLNNSANERWVIDNVVLTGTPCAYSTPTTTLAQTICNGTVPTLVTGTLSPAVNAAYKVTATVLSGAATGFTATRTGVGSGVAVEPLALTSASTGIVRYTVTPYYFGANGIDNGAAGDDCLNTAFASNEDVVVGPCPGNAGTDLKLWLRADAGVSGTTWANQVANGDATAVGTTPVVTSGAANFNPSVFMNNAGAYGGNFSYPLNSNTGANSSFVVTLLNAAATSGDGLLSAAPAGTADNSGTASEIPFYNNATNGIASFRASATRASTTGLQDQYHIFQSDFTGAGAQNILYKDGATANTVAYAAQTALNSSRYAVGTRLTSTTTSIAATGLYNGSIAEAIIYNNQLSTADAAKVQSYLALKYGITLTAASYVNGNGAAVWDTTVNTGYNNNIAGIGVEAATGLNQPKSKSINSTAILTLSNAASLTNGTYLVAGTNGGTITPNYALAGPTGFNISNREYKVQVTGTPGAVTYGFGGFLSTATVYIVVDVNGNGSYTDETPVLLTYNGTTTNMEASLNIASGRTFRFAYQEFDYGDAPASYGIAAHRVNNTLMLGSLIDGEAAPASGTTALGDDAATIDDEDALGSGIIIDGSAATYTLTVPVTNSTNIPTAKLFGWIDFNQNGIFDATEGATIVAPSTGSYTLTWTLPADVKPGAGYLRLRITSDATVTTATPTGTATDGEVEDYSALVRLAFIYVHVKGVNEESSVDFPFTLTGGPSTVAGFTLNDQPDVITPINDIGGDRSGGLWASAGTGATQGLYYRPAGSATWALKVSGAISRVDGASAGTCYYILANVVYYFDGTTSTMLGKPGGINASDLASNGSMTVATNTSYGLYQLNGANGFSQITLPAGVQPTFVDIDVSGNVYMRERSTSLDSFQVSKITPAGVFSSYPLGGIKSTGDIAVTDGGGTLLQANGNAYRYDAATTSWISEPESRGIASLTGGPAGQLWSVFVLSPKPQTILTRTNVGTGPSGPNSAYWIDDERIRTTFNDNSRMIPVQPGTYNLAEAIPAGWDVTNINLFDHTVNSTSNIANGTATINVSQSEVVHIVLENTFFQNTTVASGCGNTFNESFGTGAIGTVGAPLTGLTAYHDANSVRQIQDGEYSIVSKSSNAGYGALYDHTSSDSSGRMMVINASYAKDIFYTRRFTGMVIGANYDLSIWAASLSSGINPNINMEVYNSADNSLLASVSTGDITVQNQWLNFHLAFAPTAANIYIVLRNNNIGGSGNDLVIDDIAFGLKCDHGDAPDSYGTLNANTGVGHVIIPGLGIGATVDQEPDGQPNINAKGDDQNNINDEDGVASFPLLTVSSTVYDLPVIVRNTTGTNATLSGWIDFNRNGIFDAGERAQATVANNATSVTLHWAGLSSLSGGLTYARLRIATLATDVSTPNGAAATGEVEDDSLHIGIFISGNVFDDGNGNTVLDGAEAGTNAGGLYVNLIDSAGKVAGVAAVATNGTYSFAAPGNVGTYKVQLTTIAGVYGMLAPATQLPANWVNMGVIAGTGNTATQSGATGIIDLTTGSTSITGQSFAIEQLPVPASNTQPVQPNPGGTVSIPVPSAAFTGTDADGTIALIHYTAFPVGAVTITIGGNQYTAATFPVGGLTAAVGTSVSVDPNDTTSAVIIPFSILDNAGRESSATASVTVSFTVVTISGTVYNDANGLTDGVINGTPAGVINGNTLYVNLTDPSTSNVIAVTQVAANGTYSFNTGNGVLANAAYNLALSAVAGVPGNAAPATAITGLYNTGEGTAATGDGTPNGSISINSGSGVTGAKFGLDIRPVGATGTVAAQNNPGGTNTAPVPATAFSGTDADGSVTQIHFTTFPVTANGVTIGGTAYTAATFPAGGVIVPVGTAVAIDPIDGSITAAIPYRVLDNATGESMATDTVFVPFTLTIAGTVYDDANGLNDAAINGAATGTINGTPLFVNLIDPVSNLVLASVPAAANGTYSFPGLSSGNYSITVTSAKGSVGNPPPASGITGLAYTGEGITAGGDGTPNGSIGITLGNLPLTASFGLDQLPSSDTKTYTISDPHPGDVVVLNGAGMQPGPLTGNDGEDGAYGPVAGTHSIVLNPAGMNGSSLYYNGSQVAGITTISNYDPALLSVHFANGGGATGIAFTYNYLDAAGVPAGAAALYSLSWSIPLPLTITSFTVAPDGHCGIVALWQAATEAGISKYILQYSSDGRSFNAVAEAIAGNNSYSITYANAPEGAGYYRLQVLANDGSYTYTSTVTAVTDCASNVAITAAPNPTTGSITVSNLNGSTVLRILSTSGKLMQEYATTGSAITLNLNNLPAGMYLLSATSNNQAPVIIKIQKQ